MYWYQRGKVKEKLSLITQLMHEIWWVTKRILLSKSNDAIGYNSQECLKKWMKWSVVDSLLSSFASLMQWKDKCWEKKKIFQKNSRSNLMPLAFPYPYS